MGNTNNYNRFYRYQLIKSMEVVIRNLNNEELLYNWLQNGVADGDLNCNVIGLTEDEIENLSYYDDDKEFADLMALFLDIVSIAKDDGGLYCDGVVST